MASATSWAPAHHGWEARLFRAGVSMCVAEVLLESRPCLQARQSRSHGGCDGGWAMDVVLFGWLSRLSDRVARRTELS